ncbi:acyltransferase family protein [Granulicella arctica]|uniref:acyltransferase family protein n=1 Tax=Granulicella arctica TaxID=940613 RepID=UPI0021E01B20|nr:acyltransferase [Granulicella arctica]
MSSPARFFSPINFRMRFPALDGMRGFALIIVFLTHYSGGLGQGAVGHIIKRMRDMGWVSVDLWFVLSGFLITGILFDTRGDSHFLKRFFARRVIRILPIFYLVVVIVLLLTPILHYRLRWPQSMFLIYVGNFFTIYDPTLMLIRSSISPVFNVSFGHFWSLCIEEQFYLVWPFFVLWIPNRVRLIQTAAGISVLTLLVRTYVVWVYRSPIAETWTFHTLPFRLDTMLMGGVLALVLRGQIVDGWQRACRWVFLTACFLLAVILMLPQLYRSLMIQSVGLSIVALACVGLIGGTLRDGSLPFRLFSNRTLRYLGKYSYGFYIFHVLYSTAWSSLRIYMSRRLHSVDLAILFCIFACFPMTLMLAKLSYDLFEVRFLRLKKHFEYDSEMATHQHAFTTE